MHGIGQKQPPISRATSRVSHRCMFFLQRPTPQVLKQFRQTAERDSLSYEEVCATLKDPLPSGYHIDHNRTCLGRGEDLFERARAALDEWKMFDLGWLKLIHPPVPVTPGQTVMILAHTWGLYSLSASRVLKMVDTDDGDTRRWGFCYGTLRHHVERGEERFTVEYSRKGDLVWYDILAFSRPQHPLARLAYPVSRAAQRRFARDSKATMQRVLS
jgi:uncharacterized protein (UPF0548 family)